jgi:ATP-dependent DNA helicase RecG
MTGALGQSLAKVLGTRTSGALGKLGLETVEDLLRHYPRRHSTPGELTDMAALRDGEHVTVMAEVRTATIRQMRSRGGAMLEVLVTDGRQSLSLTFFAKRAGVLRMHEDKLRPGRAGLFTGTVGSYKGKRQLVHPDYLIVGVDAADADEATIEASRPIPIYPAAAAVPTWRIGRAVRTVLDPLTEADVPDPIPESLRRAHGLPGLLEALRGVHVPADQVAIDAATHRLRYEEALVLQTALARRRADRQSHAATARVGVAGGLLDAFDARLPFPLTAGQIRVGEEIAEDLASETPMLRLLQGDVGAGKTIVALRAMLRVVDSGGQAALLAPTEVLAAQHERTLRDLLGPLAQGGMLGGADVATRVTLLTGSQGTLARRKALGEAASGGAGIVVGTHALLSETVQFAELGLVVVDEQHRFGVEQRDALRTRGERVPHTLVMTATPIPRTVAMTVFGDLETSQLTERPAGRADTVTHVVPADNAAWMTRIWDRVREDVAAGGRAYVVCPRIDGDVPEDDAGEDPATLSSSAASSTPSTSSRGAIDPALGVEVAAKRPLEAVVEVAQRLRALPALAGISVGVMHGRLSGDEKDAAMEAFSRGRTPVLVSTTVIEVGVDVTEATVMVVLDAEHFGVSQLHQLRGRVGRGAKASLCLLVSHAEEGTLSHERLTAVAATSDGFVLAEKDLELRREGDVLGAAQSGGRNSLRLLRVVRDADLLAVARDDARALIGADPTLASAPALADAISAWLGEREDYLERT